MEELTLLNTVQLIYRITNELRPDNGEVVAHGGFRMWDEENSLDITLYPESKEVIFKYSPILRKIILDGICLYIEEAGYALKKRGISYS